MSGPRRSIAPPLVLLALVAAGSPGYARTIVGDIPQVGISGTANIPGQKCQIEYRIEITEVISENGGDIAGPNGPVHTYKTVPNKFKTKVRLKPKDPSCVPKKFFVCMMFQIKEQEVQGLEKRADRGRQVLTPTKCRDANNNPKLCWCCRTADQSDTMPEEMQDYHLGCREIDLSTGTPDAEGFLTPWQTEEAAFTGIGKELTVDDIETIYWDTIRGGADAEPSLDWTTTCGDGTPCQTPASSTNLCPAVKGQGISMGPSGSWDAVKGALGGKMLSIWAGCTSFWNFKFGEPVSYAELRIPEVRERAAACQAGTAFCSVGETSLGNFQTMGWPGTYPATMRGTFVGQPGAQVVVIIPGQVNHVYVADPEGVVAIADKYVIDSHQSKNQDMYLMVITKTPQQGGKGFRFDGEVYAGAGNPKWEAGQLMHSVAMQSMGVAAPPTIPTQPRPLFRRGGCPCDMGGSGTDFSGALVLLLSAMVAVAYWRKQGV